MATANRLSRTNINVLDQQLEHLDFFQALRIIESVCLNGGENAPFNVAYLVGDSLRPEQEPIRIQTDSAMKYFPSEIKSIAVDSGVGNSTLGYQYQVTSRLMGMHGATGVLPFHYSRLILVRNRLKDKGFETFLNLFNHRILSLYYRAWKKHQPLVVHDSHKHLKQKKTHPFKKLMLSVAGLGIPQATEVSQIRTEHLISVASLLGRNNASADAIAALAKTVLKLPVRIKQFQGHWLSIPQDCRSRLPDKNNPQGVNVQLGRSTVLGQRLWYATDKYAVVIYNVNYEQLLVLRPNGTLLPLVRRLCQLATAPNMTCKFQIHTNKKYLPRFQLTQNQKDSAILGWNALLSQRKIDQELTIVVS